MKNTIESLKDFYQKIEEFYEGIHFGELWFRGESKDYKETQLWPSIFRICEQKKALEIEKELFYYGFQFYPLLFRDLFLIMKNKTLAKLIVYQHYGLPTRLLDFTTNPLIALFFAVSDNKNEDGFVYILNPRKLNKSVNTMPPQYEEAICTEEDFNVLARLAFIGAKNYSDWENNVNNLTKEVRNEEFHKNLLKIFLFQKNFQQNEGILNEQKILKIFSTPIALEIPYTFERFKRQFSCFVLQGGFLSNSQNSVKFLNNYLKKEVLEVLIIPKECKSHIEKQLRLCGIDESLIYPDEISKIYRSIKKRIEIYLNLNLI